MDAVSGTPTAGATAEASYVVPDGAAVPTDGVFGFHAEYVTRGMNPATPHKIGSNRARCGEAIAESRVL